MKSTTTKQPQRKNTQTRTPKSKFRSVDIIRDNQPEKFRQIHHTQNEDADDCDWEDGFIPSSSSYPQNHQNYNDDDNDNDDRNNETEGMTVEFDALPDSPKKKGVRRATAEDKEVAELVHKVHLLCLVARGRLIDAACDDPLIQAALLSLLPPHLLRISEATMLTAKALIPVVSWFHQNFHVRSPCGAEKPFHLSLASALETHGGSSEEVAALSVVLLRALNLTARFVSILDVASLKPEADRDEPSYVDVDGDKKDIFGSSTLMVSKMKNEGVDAKSSVSNGENSNETSGTADYKIKRGCSSTSIECEDSLDVNHLNKAAESADETQNPSEENKNPKRKGDLEFDMQLQMALAATAVATPNWKPAVNMNGSPCSPSNVSSPLKRIKRIAEECPASYNVISTAIGSRKVGAPLYWAEVYCNGENMTGKWVHVDAVNAIVDGELKVEAAAAACKRSLRYVVAFAGHGAKDVTRRYCTKWYKISPKRTNSEWWDSVLSPLKELESHATGGMIPLHQGEMNSRETVKEGGKNHQTQACNSGSNGLSNTQHANVSRNHEESSVSSSSTVCRTTLEDMELATRALTEPLPTNQQAYRNHPLYVLEKWLTRYQVLHPKGPILGFCSGHAVYPRSCVQTLHTKERWIREGLQVREDEIPVKVVKSSYKNRRGQLMEVQDSGDGERGSDGVISLFGKWQTGPLCLPPAINGIVPKNERGQVDVWSEKCLPPGTIHLRLPRLVPVAKRLGIDFAPAMVGFEFRNGRSVPVYEGLVVCSEFRDAILEAYAEEEQRREEAEKRRDERQALSRWYQLLSSMVTRQRLNDSYRHDLAPDTVSEPPKSNNTSSVKATMSVDENRQPLKENMPQTKTAIPNSNITSAQHHEHVFVTDDEVFYGEYMMQTKRCRCGFSIQVEEM